MVISREASRRRLNAHRRARGLGGLRAFAYEQGTAAGARGPVRMTFGGSGEITDRDGFDVLDRHLDRDGQEVPMAIVVGLSSTLTREVARRITAIALVNEGETEGPIYLVELPGEPTVATEISVRYTATGRLATPHTLDDLPEHAAALLLESGGYLLLESGDRLSLEAA